MYVYQIINNIFPDVTSDVAFNVSVGLARRHKILA